MKRCPGTQVILPQQGLLDAEEGYEGVLTALGDAELADRLRAQWRRGELSAPICSHLSHFPHHIPSIKKILLLCFNICAAIPLETAAIEGRRVDSATISVAWPSVQLWAARCANTGSAAPSSGSKPSGR